MRVSEHANYLLNEYGRLQFDYAAYCKPNGESLRNEARNNLETYIAELEAERDQAKAIVSRLRDFLFDYTQFHISTNPEERWWALVDKFDELVKERER